MLRDVTVSCLSSPGCFLLTQRGQEIEHLLSPAVNPTHARLSLGDIPPSDAVSQTQPFLMSSARPIRLLAILA